MSVLWGFVAGGGQAHTLGSFPHPSLVTSDYFPGLRPPKFAGSRGQSAVFLLKRGISGSVEEAPASPSPTGQEHWETPAAVTGCRPAVPPGGHWGRCWAERHLPLLRLSSLPPGARRLGGAVGASERKSGQEARPGGPAVPWPWCMRTRKGWYWAQNNVTAHLKGMLFLLCFLPGYW